MLLIDTEYIEKEIHFPIVRAIYKKAPKRSWWKKLFKFFTYKRWFEVRENYILWVPLLNAYVFIPAFFVYDLASVPKLLNGFFNSNGMLLLGALPHDFGYRYKSLILINARTGELCINKFSKKELDSIFQDLCAWESEFTKASKFAKFMLSLVGFAGWKENRKKNADLREDFPELFAEI